MRALLLTFLAFKTTNKQLFQAFFSPSTLKDLFVHLFLTTTLPLFLYHCHWILSTEFRQYQFLSVNVCQILLLCYVESPKDQFRAPCYSPFTCYLIISMMASSCISLSMSYVTISTGKLCQRNLHYDADWILSFYYISLNQRTSPVIMKSRKTNSNNRK